MTNLLLIRVNTQAHGETTSDPPRTMRPVAYMTSISHVNANTEALDITTLPDCRAKLIVYLVFLLLFPQLIKAEGSKFIAYIAVRIEQRTSRKKT